MSVKRQVAEGATGALLCKPPLPRRRPWTRRALLHMSPRRGTSRSKPSPPAGRREKAPAAPIGESPADSPPEPASRPIPLEAYRKKRDPDCTPEPFGGASAARAREAPAAAAPAAGANFVVQQHWARNMHFDLR